MVNIGYLAEIARSERAPEGFRIRPDIRGALDLRRGSVVILDDRVHPDAPVFVDITITHSCLANCSFCYMESRPDGQHASVKRILDFIDLWSPYYPFQIALGGGEPTLHPDLPEIINEIVARQVICTFSTGRSGKRDVLASVIRKVSRVGVSVGDADGTLEALRICGPKGVLHVPMYPQEVQTACDVLMRVKQEGLSTSGLLVLTPKQVGRGRAVRVDSRQVARYFLLLSLFALSLRIPVMCDPCWSNNNFKIPDEYNLRCGGGKYSMYYNAVTGRLSRCSFLKHEETDEDPVAWWGRQSLIADCEYQMPPLFKKPLVAMLPTVQTSQQNTQSQTVK